MGRLHLKFYIHQRTFFRFYLKSRIDLLILVQVPLVASATVNCNENSVQSHTQSRQLKDKNTR